MKNTFFHYQKIYRIIRSSYMDSFPYAGVTAFDYMLSRFILNEGIDASIEATDTGHKCIIRNATSQEEAEETVFANDPIRVKFELETFLQNEENINAVIKDLAQMHKWMRDSGYISNQFIATEKLIFKSEI